jgi:large subunit ribosomal protein L18
VYRSNSEIYAQVINDLSGKTLISASSRDKELQKAKGSKIEIAKKVGMALGEKAKKAGIETILFDRGGYLFHGRVKALADGARESGLKF